ncbi:MAG: BACON domain-containing protein [Bacteroidaceae bacterium]|nr:BACON domain-containing protein [Bacteroidaceae bacterium]
MKKMFFYAAALCLTAVGFVSCTGEDEAFPAPVVSITEEEVAVPAEGGAVAFNLTAPSNEAFTVKTPEWIEFNEGATVTRGVNSSAAYHFTVAPAESCQERTGAIYIVAASGLQDSLVVVQEGVKFAVDMETATATSAGGTLVVNLTAVDGYDVEMPEWITMNEDPGVTHEGVQTAKVTFDVAQNTTGKERQGEIKFTCCDECAQSVTITVVQQGLNVDKMVKYSGTLQSLAYGDVYENTIGLIWDEEDATKVYVCNIEPYYAAGGYTVDKGFNFIEATYDAENNMIIIAPGSYFNIGELFFASTSSADLNSDIGYGYLLLNADKTQIQQPYAFYTAYFNADNSMGAEDAYAGGVIYTKVAE